ncbi:MAG: hypothetical protein AAF386_13710 [Pseudomonadota bacterium]
MTMTILRTTCVALVCASLGTVSAAQSPSFGNDSSDFANDGECDDQRFIGNGMATSLSLENIGKDASDCSALFLDGQLKLVSESAGRAATQCNKINFGDNTSDWINDGECDDARFGGRGMASDLNWTNVFRDANDCRMACDAGTIWRRVGQ